jgi:5-methylcytosine-specific restriction endonuclease McrA
MTQRESNPLGYLLLWLFLACIGGIGTLVVNDEELRAVCWFSLASGLLGLIVTVPGTLRHARTTGARYAPDKDLVDVSPAIPPNVRQAVLDRDDYICRYCGRRSQTMEVDHIIPVSQGGTSTLGNLVTACRECNRKKAGRRPEHAGMEILPVRTRKRDRR